MKNTVLVWTFVNIVYRWRTLWSSGHCTYFVNNWRPFLSILIFVFYFLFFCTYSHFFFVNKNSSIFNNNNRVCVRVLGG